MSDLSKQVGESEEQCLLTSLLALGDVPRNDLNVKQDIALNIVLAITNLPTNPRNNFLKLQTAILLRNWHVAFSLCLRGQYNASAILTRAAIEALARIICQSETDASATAWFNDDRVAFTDLVKQADDSGELLTQWRDLSEITHSKTAASAAVAGPGVLLLGAEFNERLFRILTGMLDSVLVRFLRFARESVARSLLLDRDTGRLLKQL